MKAHDMFVKMKKMLNFPFATAGLYFVFYFLFYDFAFATIFSHFLSEIIGVGG